MVLAKIDEGLREQDRCSVPARLAAAMLGSFALINETEAEDAGDLGERRSLIVAVIALFFPGELHVPGMVIIVVPLRAIFPPRRIVRGIEQAGAIIVVFQHEMNVPIQFRGRGRPRGSGRAAWDSRFGDRVYGVEPQAVEAVLVEPVKRVLDREGADLRNTIIDRAPPRRVRLRKKLGA